MLPGSPRPGLLPLGTWGTIGPPRGLRDLQRGMPSRIHHVASQTSAAAAALAEAIGSGLRGAFRYGSRPNAGPQLLRNTLQPSRTSPAKTQNIAPNEPDRTAERAEAEGDEHLMMPHALTAFDQPEVANDTIRPATHAGELRIPEMTAHTRQHLHSMHRPAIPSILTDAESIWPKRYADIDAGYPVETAKGQELRVRRQV